MSDSAFSQDSSFLMDAVASIGDIDRTGCSGWSESWQGEHRDLIHCRKCSPLGFHESFLFSSEDKSSLLFLFYKCGN